VHSFDESERAARGKRAAALLALSVLGLTPVAVLLVVTPATWQAATAPGADVSALLAGLAAAAGWVVAARLVVTALAVALAALPGSCGRAGRRLAAAWSPALVRGLVRAALGAAVATGPLLAGPAASPAFADAGPPSTPLTLTMLQVLPALPTLDRVVAMPASAHPTRQPARPPKPVTTGAATSPGSSPNQGGGHVVVVQPGDSLWTIAASHLPREHTDAEVAAAWPGWYAANRAAIGADPGHIEPGLRLAPPS
jgi:resuscitation-promoting factor RpfA